MPRIACALTLGLIVSLLGPGPLRAAPGPQPATPPVAPPPRKGAPAAAPRAPAVTEVPSAPAATPAPAPERSVRPEAVTPLRDAGTRSMSWARWALWNGLAGFGAAALTVPGTLALGHEIGKHGPSYLAAALPGLLLLLALPPSAVMATEFLLGRRLKPGTLRFHPAFWTAIGVQLVTMVIAIAAGTTTHELGGASAFAVADALILPGTVTLMLYLTRRRTPGATEAPGARLPDPPRSGGRAALQALGEQRWLEARSRLAPTPAGGVIFDVLRARF